MKSISTNIAFIKCDDSGKYRSHNKETIQNYFIQNNVDRKRSDFPLEKVFIEFLWLHLLNNKIQERVMKKKKIKILKWINLFWFPPWS